MTSTYLYQWICIYIICIETEGPWLTIAWLMIVHLIMVQKWQVFSRKCALKLDITLACDAQGHTLSLCWAVAVSCSWSQPCARKGGQKRRYIWLCCYGVMCRKQGVFDAFLTYNLVFFFGVLRHGLTPNPKLAFNLWSSCLYLLGAGITVYTTTPGWLITLQLTIGLLGHNTMTSEGACKHMGICYI